MNWCRPTHMWKSPPRRPPAITPPSRLGVDDKLPNFRIHLDRMDSAVDLVLQTTRKAYPSFEVPFHSRWRHFVMSGDNRWADIADRIRWPDRAARARAEFDLAIVSVFLDAGAAPARRNA